jgi:cyclopropane-fatty-acyl-phospholipid synthase
MPAQNERLGRASRALAELVSAKSGGQIAFRLWTGELVAARSSDGKPPFEIRISSPAALRQLILSPAIESAAKLYAAGDFDFGDVHPIELMRRVDHTKFTRKLDWREKLLVAKSIVPIIRHGGKYADPMAFTGQQGRIAGKDRDDKSLINFHYDLSNRFYELFLGEELAYSCAYFEREGATLDEAQRAKHDLVCRKLRLAPGLKLFDTGCGWGGLICHAAKHYGVSAHGVTLSKEQHAFAAAKIARMGLQDLVTVELRDYRSVTAPDSYDRIAQIEMFEHVGIDNHDDHFRHVHRLLRPRGLYLHQASTRRPTPDLSQFRKPTVYQKFTTRYIFPGGELDYIGLSVTNLERNGFEVHDVENLREHYQKTAEAWANNLWRNRAEAAKEVGEGRTRMWLAYLSATTVAFRRLNLNVFQTLASKRRIGPSGLPLDRRWMMNSPDMEKTDAIAEPGR